MARRILAVFAEAYPQSAHYRGGRRVRKAGWSELIPELERNVDTKEDFLAAVDELVAAGIVSVKWQRFRVGSEVEALYLDDADALFAALGRASPESIRLAMRNALDEPAWRDGGVWITPVREHLVARLDASHPVPVANERDLRDLAVLLHVTAADARASAIRALSVRLFNDSKRLESLLRVADQLTTTACGRSFSTETGLSRRFPELSVALLGSLELGDRRWECKGEALTLPADTAAQVTFVKFGRRERAARRTEETEGGDSTRHPVVLSVENKETFHVLAERLRDGSLESRIRAVTYCGGHPHRAYVAFLALCSQCGAGLYHFGDMDPDGLLILGEIAAQLTASVRPWLMDLPTYERYLGSGYAPPESRIERLAASIESLPAAIVPLANAIIASRVGVEQEVVSVPGNDASETRQRI